MGSVRMDADRPNGGQTRVIGQKGVWRIERGDTESIEMDLSADNATFYFVDTIPGRSTHVTASQGRSLLRNCQGFATVPDQESRMD